MPRDRLTRQITQIYIIFVVARCVRYTAGQTQNQGFCFLPVVATGKAEAVRRCMLAVGDILTHHAKIKLAPCFAQITITVPYKFIQHMVFEIAERRMFIQYDVACELLNLARLEQAAKPGQTMSVA